MKIDSISILPIEEIRIIKQVFIISELECNKEYTIGYILYERQLSQDYRFKETSMEERVFSYYLEYPKQDNYPVDEIDMIILHAIKNSFPKSYVRNHSLICNVEKEHIRFLQNRPTEKGVITITPDFSMMDITNIKLSNFSGLEMKILIYTNFKKGNIINTYFQGYYDLNRPEILDRLNEIKFI
jgi:hypothetical protein